MGELWLFGCILTCLSDVNDLGTTGQQGQTGPMARYMLCRYSFDHATKQAMHMCTETQSKTNTAPDSVNDRAINVGPGFTPKQQLSSVWRFEQRHRVLLAGYILGACTCRTQPVCRPQGCLLQVS